MRCAAPPRTTGLMRGMNDFMDLYTLYTNCDLEKNTQKGIILGRKGGTWSNNYTLYGIDICVTQNVVKQDLIVLQGFLVDSLVCCLTVATM